MGKYDGPHFDRDDENVVSIWVAIVPWSEIPDDYWQYDFSGDDNAPFNRFSSDFGFGYYDDDFVESYFDEPTKGIVPLRDLLTPLSYSESFVDAAVEQSQALGLEKTAYVFLMYNFDYAPAVTGVDRSKYFRFLGAFPFVDE